MTENTKNNLWRGAIGVIATGAIAVGLVACDGTSASDQCDDAIYYSQHAADCNDGGAISPYGYGVNY